MGNRPAQLTEGINTMTTKPISIDALVPAAMANKPGLFDTMSARSAGSINNQLSAPYGKIRRPSFYSGVVQFEGFDPNAAGGQKKNFFGLPDTALSFY